MLQSHNYVQLIPSVWNIIITLLNMRMICIYEILHLPIHSELCGLIGLSNANVNWGWTKRKIHSFYTVDTHFITFYTRHKYIVTSTDLFTKLYWKKWAIGKIPVFFFFSWVHSHTPATTIHSKCRYDFLAFTRVQSLIDARAFLLLLHPQYFGH